METIDMVHQFHMTAQHPVRLHPDLSDGNLCRLRVDLLYEELGELTRAIVRQDEVEVLDALCDLQYVLDGAFLALGFATVKQQAMEEVHRANMSKLRDAVRRPDGKILKGPHYRAPDLSRFIAGK